MILEQLFSGLVLGCIYGLVALGFSLIYSAFQLPHFAQGDLLMLGAVIGLIASRFVGLNFVPVLLITVVGVGGIGILMERLIYRKLSKHAIGPKIICTVTVGILLQNIVLVTWGSRPQSFPDSGFSGFPIVFGDRVFPPVYTFIILVTLILVIILSILLLRTKIGLAMRATAYSHDLAELMGVKTSSTLLITFAIGAGLAGAAGLLIGQLLTISYTMGIAIGQKGFIAAVIGGFGNIPGALLGGLFLGVVENIGAGFVSSGLKDVISFGVLLLVLLVRPSGLFARVKEEKV